MATDEPRRSFFGRVLALVQEDSEFDRDHVGPSVFLLTATAIVLAITMSLALSHSQAIFEWLTVHMK